MLTHQTIGGAGIEPGAAQAVTANGNGQAILPDSADLFAADFARDGLDLIVTAPDGTAHVVIDYYASVSPPMLVAQNGGVMPQALIDALTAANAPHQFAQAGDTTAADATGAVPIGQVETLDGSATATRPDGGVVSLAIGSLLFEGDVVQTGTGSDLGLVFADETVLQLGPAARMVLDEFSYAPGAPDNNMLFSLVEGVFVFVAGLVAPSGNMELNTPVATMGVRGTSGILEVVNQAGQSTFSLTNDPDGGLGVMEIANLVTRDLIFRLTDTDTQLVVFDAAGAFDTIDKSPDLVAIEALLIEIAFETYALVRARIDAGEPPVNLLGQPGTDTPTDPQDDDNSDDNGGEPENGDRRGNLDNGLEESGGFGFADLLPDIGGDRQNTDLVADTERFTDLINDLADAVRAVSIAGGADTTPTDVAILEEEEDPVVPAEPIPTAISLPNAPIVDEDGEVSIAGIIITGDPDAAITVSLAAQSTVTLGTIDGLVFLIGDGTADEEMVFIGTATDVAAALETITYFPTADNDVIGGISFEITDGTTTQQATMQVFIRPQPDPPRPADDRFDADEDGVLRGNVLDDNGSGPDFDPDSGDPLQVVIVNGSRTDVGQVITLPSGAELQLNSDGSFIYRPSEGLSEGQIAPDIFTYTLADSSGNEIRAASTVVVRGANDAPVVVNPVFDATLTEAPGQSGSNTRLVAPTEIRFSDPDLADGPYRVETRLINQTGETAGLPPANQLEGVLTYAPVTQPGGGAQRVVVGSFDPQDRLFDYLGVGDAVTLTFRTTVTDVEGARTSQDIRITVTGTNDRPVVQAVTATVGEDDTAVANLLAGQTDLDANDVLSATNVATAVTTTGPLGFTLVLGTHYTIINGQIDFTTAGTTLLNQLSQGETEALTLGFDVDDGNPGGSVGTTLDVSIIGANDAHVSGGSSNAALTEVAGVTGSPANDLQTATILFTDVDTNQTGFGASVASVATAGATAGLPGATILEGFATVTGVTKAAGTNTGAVNLEFSAQDQVFDYLADGEIVTLSYTIDIDDGAGTTIQETFEVVVTGTNDVPTVTAIGRMTSEDTLLTVDLLDGQVDVDLSDTLTTTNVATSVTTTVTALTATLGVHYNVVADEISFTAAGDTLFDQLASGETAVFTLTYDITDGTATSANAFQMSIIGSNDAPVVSTISAAVTEGADAATDLLRAPEVSDVDVSDALFVDSFDNSVTTTEGLTLILGTHFALSSAGDFELTGTGIDLFDSLALGASDTFTLNYVVGDGTVTVDNTFDVAIAGENDAPEISDEDRTSGTLFELSEGDVGEGTAARSVNVGTYRINDPDIGDNHTFSVTARGTNPAVPFTPTFSFDEFDDIGDNGGGSLDIDFEINDGSLNFLQEGELIELFFDLTITDTNGLSVTTNATGPLGFSVVLNGANDTAEFTIDAGSQTVTFLENTVNATPQTLVGAFSFDDVDYDPSQGSNGTLLVSGNIAEDVISIDNQGTSAGQIGFNNATGEITYEGTLIGIVDPTDNGANGFNLDITFNGNASLEAVEALIGALTYANTSDTPTASRTLTITFDDGDINGTVSDTVVVNVTPEVDTTVTSPVTLSTLTASASRGYEFQGVDAGDVSGFKVTSAGDINGDGFDDLLISSWVAGAPGLTNSGEVYLVFGGAANLAALDGNGDGNILLSDIDGTNGYVLNGDAGDRAGSDIASADLNGDGIMDLVIGARFSEQSGNTQDGQVYVVFGGTTNLANADDSTPGNRDGRIALDGIAAIGAGYIIEGEAAGDQFGFTVSNVGDTNGDGFDDIMVFARQTLTGAGVSYLIYGGSQNLEALDAADGSNNNVLEAGELVGAGFSGFGYRLIGESAGDLSGIALSGGDFDGDGVSDILIGAPRGGFIPANDTGHVNIIVDTTRVLAAADAVSPGTDGSVNMSAVDSGGIPAPTGYTIQGANFDEIGFAVDGTGDANGDGRADVLIGAPFDDRAGTEQGAAHLLFSNRLDVAGTGADAIDGNPDERIETNNLNATNGFTFITGVDGDTLGSSVSFAGDINGDGYDDLLIGAGQRDTGAGATGSVFLVFGGMTNLNALDALDGANGTINLGNLDGTNGFEISGNSANDRLAGWWNLTNWGVAGDVSAAGDVDGDGYDDLIVSASVDDPNTLNDAGSSFLIFGEDYSGVVTTQGGALFTGTAAAENIIGSTTNDTLIGKGGADVIRSGAGDDRIVIADAAFRQVDGGTGLDTLELEGGMNLNLENIGNLAIRSIERIDMNASDNNTLTLSLEDVFDLSDSFDSSVTATANLNRIRIDGSAGDTLDLNDAPAGHPADGGGWTNNGTATIGAETYTIYNYFFVTAGSDIVATLAVDSDITVV
ncbi:MAG: Ig-like domain-containing protein [Pseudomonadota bacterium]